MFFSRDKFGRFIKKVNITNDDKIENTIPQENNKPVLQPRAALEGNIITELQRHVIITHEFETAELAAKYFNENFVEVAS